MSWSSIVSNIQRMIASFLTICSRTYLMIEQNTLLLVFVLMCAIFVGLTLLKRLIHIH